MLGASGSSIGESWPAFPDGIQFQTQGSDLLFSVISRKLFGDLLERPAAKES
jgi:hypothetical protein